MGCFHNAPHKLEQIMPFPQTHVTLLCGELSITAKPPSTSCFVPCEKATCDLRATVWPPLSIGTPGAGTARNTQLCTQCINVLVCGTTRHPGPCSLVSPLRTFRIDGLYSLGHMHHRWPDRLYPGSKYWKTWKIEEHLICHGGPFLIWTHIPWAQLSQRTESPRWSKLAQTQGGCRGFHALEKKAEIVTQFLPSLPSSSTWESRFHATPALVPAAAGTQGLSGTHLREASM